MQVRGQTLALQYLELALSRRLNTAYCFAGPEGVGKALTARWFVQVLLCQNRVQNSLDLDNLGQSSTQPCQACPACHQGRNHPDLLWLEPTYKQQNQLIPLSEAIASGVSRRTPPQIRLEQVRALSRFASRTPIQAPYSLIVIEGAETLAEAAANALLKTLEEPGQARLILLTTSLNALLPTIVSRCQLIPFRPLANDLVRTILTEQGYGDIPAPLLAMTQGSPGLAIATLAQWQQLDPSLIPERWPQSLRESLTLARQISKTLDGVTQLWLVDYLQHHFWAQGCRAGVERLEALRRHLRAFVAPQLAWEIHLRPLGSR